jgi:hypothetical protein
VDNIHLKLYPQNLKSWSIAINKEPDVVTIDICPIELAKILMTAKATLKNPLRDAPETTPSKTTQNAVPPSATLPPPYPFPYYFPYSVPSYPQHFLPPPPYAQHLPAPTTADMATIKATTAIPDEPPSSPPSDDKLSEYISWLARINPKTAEQLLRCKEALTDNDIVFNTLFDVPDKYFEKWGVSLGIQMLLKSHKLKFEKARLKGHIQDI